MYWKSIADTKYEVSDTGLVRNSTTGKLLKPKLLKYLTVGLCTDGKSKDVAIHRLVAELFLPNPNNFPVVKHLDNNKHNNMVSNLAWDTYSGNLQDAIHDGLNCVGRQVGLYKDNVLVKVLPSLSATAHFLGLAFPSNGGASAVKSVCDGKRNTLKGYAIKYMEEGGEYSLV